MPMSMINHTITWKTMLGKDERDAADEEIAALGGRARAVPARRRRGLVRV